MGLLSRREYGKMMGGNLLIAAFFGGAFAFVLAFSWPLLEAGNDTLLAKIGTMTSVGGVFLGAYVATLLVNQNRSRRIEENYFYKVSFLANAGAMVAMVIGYIDVGKREDDSWRKDKTSVKRMKENQDKFEYHVDKIEAINANALVPADIRAGVELLLRHGKNCFEQHGEETRRVMVQEYLLCYLNVVIDSKYFANDHDKEVRRRIKFVKKLQKTLEKSVGINSHI